MKRRTSPPSGKTESQGIFADAAIFLLTVGLLFLLRAGLTPTVQSVTLATAERTYTSDALPLFKDSDGSDATVVLSLNAPQLHPRSFSVKVDDCLQSLVVNDLPVIPDLERVVCSPHAFTHFPLGQYLKPGDNTLFMELSDSGGVTVGIDLHPSATDPLMLLTIFGFLLVGAWFLWNIFSLQRIKRIPLKSLLAFFFIGTFLRILYVISTPYAERAHDTDAHIDYIQFVLQSWKMPYAANGWEYHQAPLYYYFAAANAKVAAVFGVGFDTALSYLQRWSLLFSVLSLGVLLCSVHLLFAPARRMERWVAAVIVTALPGAVYFASRITNEALSSLLSFIVLLLLLAWWKNGNRRLWYAAWAVTALMFITKINALLFVPILILCFLLRAGKPPLKKRLVPLYITLLLFLAAVSWLPIVRFLEPNVTNTLTLGNKNMDNNLRVERGLREFTTFNPVAMADKPFNNSWRDTNRRSNFFEYFFRSAFFGEFQFADLMWIATGIIILAYILVLPLLVGVLRNIRRPTEWLPLHLTAGATFLIALLYAMFFPYAPNQDFRQSILLLLPIAYYVADGITLFPRPVRHIFIGTLFALALGIALFISLLYVKS